MLKLDDEVLVLDRDFKPFFSVKDFGDKLKHYTGTSHDQNQWVHAGGRAAANRPNLSDERQKNTLRWYPYLETQFAQYARSVGRYDDSALQYKFEDVENILRDARATLVESQAERDEFNAKSELVGYDNLDPYEKRELGHAINRLDRAREVVARYEGQLEIISNESNLREWNKANISPEDLNKLIMDNSYRGIFDKSGELYATPDSVAKDILNLSEGEGRGFGGVVRGYGDVTDRQKRDALLGEYLRVYGHSESENPSRTVIMARLSDVIADNTGGDSLPVLDFDVEDVRLMSTDILRNTLTDVSKSDWDEIDARYNDFDPENGFGETTLGTEAARNVLKAELLARGVSPARLLNYDEQYKTYSEEVATDILRQKNAGAFEQIKELQSYYDKLDRPEIDWLDNLEFEGGQDVIPYEIRNSLSTTERDKARLGAFVKEGHRLLGDNLFPLMRLAEMKDVGGTGFDVVLKGVGIGYEGEGVGFGGEVRDPLDPEETGKRGDFKFSIDKDGVAYGDLLELFKQVSTGGGQLGYSSHSGGREAGAGATKQGFGTKAIHMYEDVMRSVGVKAIKIQANISEGGYAWARCGYDFADKEDLKMLLAKARSRWKARYPGVDFPDDVNLAHSWNIASLTGPDGAQVGKETMLGSNWNAIKWLDDNDLGYQVGQAYYESKSKPK